MHVPGNEAEFLQDIRGFLGCYYLAAALLNTGAAWCWWRGGDVSAGQSRAAGSRLLACVWGLLAAGFAAAMSLAWSGEPDTLRWISFPATVRDVMDRVLGPTWFMVGSSLALACAYFGRRIFSRPEVAWAGLNLVLVAMGFSLTDPDFAAIVAKPDNVPIVGLIFLLGFFTWLATRKAVLNDQRLARGQGPVEAEDNEQVLVWPDLVYIELICMVAVTVLLIVWSILLKAPLEAEASTVATPNPSKAPWYFLGLQEMLLYFDPWMAGVVLPSLIILGLMAIPYLDVNPAGNGYYTIQQRRFAYLVFQFGFLVLWIALMLIGTFFRGPNWSFFGFFETWDVHKVEALNNVQLSQRFWVDFCGVALPEAAQGAGFWTRTGYVLWRELPGLVLLCGYFIALPIALTRSTRFFRQLSQRVGRWRYLVLIALLLIMILLPIKMVCRWSFNLNYFVSIPELSFNL